MKKLISLCLVLAILLPTLAACDEKVLSALGAIGNALTEMLGE